MEKFLYLTKLNWADAWIEGGEVPLNLASSYISKTRDGVMTPDENRIHESEFPIPDLKRYGIHVADNATVKNMTITGNRNPGGVRVPEIRGANYYTEDGLILCLCNNASEKIAEKFKKKACVKIIDIEQTKIIIDEQLKCTSIMKSCEYTEDHNRNHFLKSSKDEWQDEFRLFWENTNDVWKKGEGVKVNIPMGTAELVWAL